MPDPQSIENAFLKKITEIILANISNEQFGVSELAGEIGMSRSNLLRKLKKLTKLSVSQFIRQVRLEEAMEMLNENAFTVSEISYKVGFSSTSYFIKCFHDHYGYPPGEVNKRDLGRTDKEEETLSGSTRSDKNKKISFWDELKRRKVVKVIVVYASISFIVLQLVSVLIEPLYLPQWIMTLIIVLLAIGFPIAIVFSWIFDLTPSGLEVTRPINENEPQPENSKGKKGILSKVLIGVLLIIVAALAYPKLVNGIDESKLDQDLERSIAVLPFINDSNDPTNVHIINGLMESILNNLQKIEDLKVVSRTSVEKYRNSKKTISEIAKELNVNYFIEGSGQKIGDRIQLNVQLIEAPTDNHLWAEQYNRDATDIFELQSEVAKNIAGRIEAIITPEEEERIDKVPTDNLVAYDHFLKGLDLLYQRKRESLEEAIIYFKKAIAEDKDFAHAYAYIAIAYYYLDIAQTEKKYSIEISDNADKALLLDQQLTQSLVAKALFYMHSAEYELAVPYFEKALEYNPNSAWVINLLSDFYTSYIPNTQKYLEYALRGIKLDIASNDSITTSFIYLHVSNAFIQTGFVDEAEKYINRSLTYDHDNLYSEYVKAYILYVKNRDLLKIKERLIKALNKDRSRLDIIQEVGKICYFMRDYEEAYVYYKKFIEMKEAQNLDIYRGENAKIAMVMSKIGMKEEAEIYISDFKEYADNNRSIYKHLSMAMYHSYRDDTAKAIDHLELFLKEDNYHYWIILFLKIDPLTDNIKELPEFKRIFEEIEKKFWKDHEQIKISLEEKDLL